MDLTGNWIPSLKSWNFWKQHWQHLCCSTTEFTCSKLIPSKLNLSQTKVNEKRRIQVYFKICKYIMFVWLKLEISYSNPVGWAFMLKSLKWGLNWTQYTCIAVRQIIGSLQWIRCAFKNLQKSATSKAGPLAGPVNF